MLEREKDLSQSTAKSRSVLEVTEFATGQSDCTLQYRKVSKQRVWINTTEGEGMAPEINFKGHKSENIVDLDNVSENPK